MNYILYYILFGLARENKATVSQPLSHWCKINYLCNGRVKNMFLYHNFSSKLSNHLISEITYQIYPTCYNLQYIIYFYTFIDSLQEIVSMIEINNFTKECEWVEIVKILFKGNQNW